jgi:hypothetical protein
MQHEPHDRLTALLHLGGGRVHQAAESLAGASDRLGHAAS